MAKMPIAALACYGAILGATTLAWLRGGAAERLGGALFLVMTGVDLVARLAVPAALLTDGLLVADGLMALGFLALALRFGSLWLGGALLFQAAQFSLHAFYLVTGRPLDLIHAVANNLDTYGVAACIAVGALTARRPQAREA
jgi:hypothetical protein